MPAGTLRDRVTFQEPVPAPDGMGGYVVAWSDQFTTWSQFMPERGRERVEQGRINDAVGGVLRVRCSSETARITAAWRVMIGGEVYNIRSKTNPDRRYRYYEMTIERGVAT